MSKKFTIVVIFCLALVSFFVGRFSAEAHKNAEYLDALVTTSNLVNDRWAEVKVIEALFEATQQKDANAKNQFVLAVSLKYRDDTHIRNLSNPDHEFKMGQYSTNKAVIEFLEEHGFSSCKKLAESALVQCNLKMVENDV